MMDTQSRQRLRLAAAIHEQLTESGATPNAVVLPQAAWNACVSTRRRMQLARLRGWNLAAEKYQERLANHVKLLQEELASLSRTVQPRQQTCLIMSVAEIYRDLVSLGCEFDDVKWDLEHKTLSVHTESITLEGVYLGPFEIKLEIQGMPDYDSYRVKALDPNPAGSNDNVTHPHVDDEQVCEGDGKVAIHGALAQGRVTDFFLLVANLLRTYNAASPYVALSDWNGTRCDDCSALVSEDDRSVCERCGNDICRECTCVCSGCGGYFCSTCVVECEDCGEPVCASCLQRCDDCNSRFCEHCLEAQQCGNCRQEQEESQNENESETEHTVQQPAELAV